MSAGRIEFAAAADDPVGSVRTVGTRYAPARRIVCAAIRAEDGSLLLGIRHYSSDMNTQIAARVDGSKFKHRGGEDQGFVDQHGVYLTRREAYDVAMRAGQVVNHDACEIGRLYSEGLY